VFAHNPITGDFGDNLFKHIGYKDYTSTEIRNTTDTTYEWLRIGPKDAQSQDKNCEQIRLKMGLQPL